MIFEESFITTAGRDLLTRADAGWAIIWDKCGCYAQNINSMSQSQVNALEDLESPCALGSSSAVFEEHEGDESVAKVTCQVTNASTGCTAGYANSFGVWAKLKSPQGVIDDESTLVIVSRVGDNAPTYFPDYTDERSRLLGIYDFSVTVNGSAASTINITQSGVAIASDLQHEIDAREALESRVVTTKDADGEGEAQEIFGEKQFHDRTTFHGAVDCHDDVLCYGIGSPHSGWTVTVNSTLEPISDATIDIGLEGKRFGKIYCEQAFTGPIECSSLIFKDEEESTALTVSSNYMEGTATIETENNTLAIKAPMFVFDGGDIEIYANGDLSITMSGNIDVSSNSISVDCQITANEFKGNLADGSLVPHPRREIIEGTEKLIIPIGSIICIYKNGIVTVGETISCSENSIQFGRLDGGPVGGLFIPSGTYQAITAVSMNGGSFLAIKIN